MRAVGIRELKNRLSAYLRLVRGGEEILVTDRGVVIAELRQPGSSPADSVHGPLTDYVRRGKARFGAPNRPDVYPALEPVLPPGRAQQLLDQDRGER